MWLEVMLLAGVTGMPAEVERLAELAARIAPDRIQLNTAVRPPAESFVAPVADGSLQELAGLFTPHAEVIADTAPADGDRVAARADILALLSRRPCTVADIAAGLGIHHGEALKAVTALVTEGALDLHTHDDRSFYVVATAAADESTRGEIMKVAISAQSNDIDSLVDPGSAAPAGSSSPTRRPASGRLTTTPPTSNASGGAGVQAGSTVASQGAEAVITGNVGPNAHKVLAAANIAIYQAGNGISVQRRAGRVQARRAGRGGGSHRERSLGLRRKGARHERRRKAQESPAAARRAGLRRRRARADGRRKDGARSSAKQLERAHRDPCAGRGRRVCGAGPSRRRGADAADASPGRAASGAEPARACTAAGQRVPAARSAGAGRGTTKR